MTRDFVSGRVFGESVLWFACMVFCAWILAPGIVFAQQYYCSACGRGFSHPGRAQTHIEKKHHGEGQVRSYATDGTYISPTVAPVAGRRCPRCGKLCENAAHLRNHMAQCNVRRGKKGAATAPAGQSPAIPYYCKWCKKSFPTHADAARHAASCPSNPQVSGKKSGGVEAGSGQVGAVAPRPVARPEDDVIILKNGERFVGDVQLMTKDSVTLKTPSGAEVTFTKNQVQDILGIKALKMLRAVKAGKGPQTTPEHEKTD